MWCGGILWTYVQSVGPVWSLVYGLIVTRMVVIWKFQVIFNNLNINRINTYVVVVVVVVEAAAALMIMTVAAIVEDHNSNKSDGAIGGDSGGDDYKWWCCCWCWCYCCYDSLTE